MTKPPTTFGAVVRHGRGWLPLIGGAALVGSVITLALQMRFRSRQSDSFGAKVVAALRKEFGGHATKKA